MKENKEKKISFESGAGGFLGGLFKGLEKLIDLADKVGESGAIQKEGEFTIPGEKEVKGVYGFTIKTMAGPGGQQRPVIQPFGNIKKTPKGAVVEETREPIVDTFEEGESVRIVAEMPGVGENEVQYEIHGDVVSFFTTGKRKYSKEVLLKYPVDDKGAEVSYKNGMFELKLKKKPQ